MHLSYKISTKPRNKFVMLASIILCFVLIFLGTFQATPLVLDTDADTNTYWSDNATSFDPDATTGKYYVYTPGQLAYIFLKLPKSNTINVELMADIEMGAHIWNSTTFDANLNFEGNNHIILNLICNNSKSCGLIKSSSGGDICFKNTRLFVDFNLSGNTSDTLYTCTENRMVGGMISIKQYIYYTSVKGNYSNGYVSVYDGSKLFYGDDVGSYICSVSYDDSYNGSLNFENCITHGKIVINQNLNSIGGFVGICSPPLSMTKCFNNITITNNSGCIIYGGGLVGDTSWPEELRTLPFYYDSVIIALSEKFTRNISMCGNCGDLIGNFVYVGGISGCEFGMNLENLKSYNCAKIQTNINLYKLKSISAFLHYGHKYQFVFTGGNAGGLFGFIDTQQFYYKDVTHSERSHVSYAYNTGEIISNGIGGGIIGESYSDIIFDNIYSVGDIIVPTSSLFHVVKGNNLDKILHINDKAYEFDKSHAFAPENFDDAFGFTDIYYSYYDDSSYPYGYGKGDFLGEFYSIAGYHIGVLKDISLIGNAPYNISNSLYLKETKCYKTKPSSYDNIGDAKYMLDISLLTENSIYHHIDYINDSITSVTNSEINIPGTIMYQNTFCFDTEFHRESRYWGPDYMYASNEILYANRQYIWEKYGRIKYKGGFGGFEQKDDGIFYDRYEGIVNSSDGIFKCNVKSWKNYISYGINKDKCIKCYVAICPELLAISKHKNIEFTGFPIITFTFSEDIKLSQLEYEMENKMYSRDYSQQQDITADKFDGDVFVQSDGDLPVFKDLVW